MSIKETTQQTQDHTARILHGEQVQKENRQRISNMESTLSSLKDEVVMECKSEIKDELKKELNQEWDVVFKLSTLRDQFFKMQESMIEQSVDREKLNKKCNNVVTEQMKLQALIADLKASKTSANDEKTDMKQIKACISDFNTRVSDLELDVGIHKDSITSHSKEIQHANNTIIPNGKEVQSTFWEVNQMVMDLNTKMLDVQSTNNKELDKIRSNINEVKQLLSQEIRNIKMEMNCAQPPHVAPSTIPVESATQTTHPTMPPPSTPATLKPTGIAESPLDLTMLMDYTAAAKLSLPTL